MSRRRMETEAQIMGRLAALHACRDQRAGDGSHYRLMETLAAQGKIRDVSWEVYRAAYADRRAPIGAPAYA